MKWDRAKAWPGGVTHPAGCGACGRASQARHRGALGSRPTSLRGSAFNGWTRNGRGAGESLPWEAKRSPAVPGSTAPGTEIAADGAPERRFRSLCFPPHRETCGGTKTKSRLSALRLPSQGRQNYQPTSHRGARTRTLGCLKFEFGNSHCVERDSASPSAGLVFFILHRN